MRSCFAVLIFLPAIPLFAEIACPTPPCNQSLLGPRSITGVRARSPLKIDGKLDDPDWSLAPVATGMIQSSPHPGKEATLRTEARFLVDDQALYIGIRAFDPTPAKIAAPLHRRDDESYSDWLFVELDTRFDRRSAYSFGLNPRGVQVDGAWNGDINYDDSWNAVWEGSARIDDEGWTAEFRIPFSQLNYAGSSDAGELATWGVNIYRNSRGHGEVSNWSPRYAGLGGIVSYFNVLKLPLPGKRQRLEMTPYLAPFHVQGQGGTANQLRSGADFSMGLGSNFNLTATILPDFGQVEADPSQVNLTAFELYQTERRPFFVEGFDMFAFNTALDFTTRGDSFLDESPFYSRRVGHAPSGQLPVDALSSRFPQTTSLLGAVKLSGRTSNNWSIGAFSALTGNQFAEVALPAAKNLRWPVDPQTAYTTIRAVKSSESGDTSGGLFFSNVVRPGMQALLASQFASSATVFGADFTRRFSRRRYEVRAWTLASYVSGSREAIALIGEQPQHYFQRPDGFRKTGSSLAGLAGNAEINKVSGAFRWQAAIRTISRGFEVGELGFQRNADWILLTGGWRWERYPASGLLRSWAIGSNNTGIGWTLRGETRARTLGLFTELNFRDLSALNILAGREFTSLSVDWLRGGPALLLPPRTDLKLSWLSNTRRKNRVTVDADYWREPASGSRRYWVNPVLLMQVSNRLAWSFGPLYDRTTIGWQYVTGLPAAGATNWLVGRVRQNTFATTLRMDYVLSPRLVVQFYGQPFVSAGRYDRFQQLTAPRVQAPLDRFAPVSGVTFNPDNEQRTLNSNLIARWEYRPGSFLTFVWNQQRNTYGPREAGSSWGRLFADPQANALMLKFTYRIAR